MKQSEATVKASRRIGLGTMGLAHMLVRVGVRYDSKDGVQLAEQVIRSISKQALEATRQLAKERGPFPASMPVIPGPWECISGPGFPR